MTATNRTRADVLARLEPYWKMERASMVTIPLTVLLLTQARIGWVTLVPLVAVVALLAIGTAFWRMKVIQLRRESADSEVVMRRIDKAQIPALLLTIAGCATAMLGWFAPSLSVGRADRIAATVCAFLAVLEYVNYYHRQVQHFDNKADFARMLAGKGFRPSWMARDLAAYRAKH